MTWKCLACAKFQGNRFRIDAHISTAHPLLASAAYISRGNSLPAGATFISTANPLSASAAYISA